jgi:hypothetical protein
MLKLIIIGSIPTADGYIFTAVMGYVLGMNMALQNSAFNAIVGLMIVQSGNVIAKNILTSQRSCSAAIP